MFLSDGNIDQVDLDLLTVTRIGQIWEPIPPQYWASAKVWRPRFFGSVLGQVGGVLFGSPKGLYAWDGTTLSSPGDLAPDWLTDQLETDITGPPTIMPVGLPGIYTMEVYSNRLWVAGKDVVSYSAPSNGADFSTTNGGGSFGYFGDKLTYSYMDLCSSAGYLFAFGDSSIDLISNIQMTGQGTVTDPFITNFNYANLDPQAGQRFPRPVGRYGRYMTAFNGAGIFLCKGGEMSEIGQKVTNLYNTLEFPVTVDDAQVRGLYMPTFAPATMFGFRVMLANGRFTDPFGRTRSLLLMWHPQKGKPDFWSVANQNLELTNINFYEQDSIITPYGTDGNSLYQLFAQPDPALRKELSTKSLRGQGMARLQEKNFKRLYCEIHDNYGMGVSITGRAHSGGGDVVGGTQDFGFELTQGEKYRIAAYATNGAGIYTALDLESVSPDFTIERLHVGAEERSFYGA
jgi:hypothetical protein